MPLETLPDDSHRFYMPQNPNTLFDIAGLINPRTTTPYRRPPGAPRYIEVPVPGYPGLFAFEYVPSGRGRFRQQGFFEENGNDFAEGSMVWDDDETCRLPFKIRGQQTPVAGLMQGGRLCGAHFFNKDVFGHSEPLGPHLYMDSGSGYDCAVSLVPGYSAGAGQNQLLCMEAVNFNGAPALLLGYGTGAASTIQALTDLNNPPTSTLLGMPVTGAVSTYGLCQVGVDGDSIQAYTGNQISMYPANVAIAASAQTPRIPITPGGYTIGLMSMGYNPEVWYCIPTNGYPFLDDPNFLTPWEFAASSFRGKIVRVDLRAYTIQEVDIALAYVVYATKTKYGLFYCDGHNHRYMVAGADIPVDPQSDRPVGPTDLVPVRGGNRKRLCRGHHVFGDRIFWDEIEYDPSRATLTTWTRYEYDVYEKRAFPVSKLATFAFPGILGVGGPRQPVSQTTSSLISNIGGEWVMQFQNLYGENGYGLRHQDGTLSSSGPEYESAGYWRLPQLRSRAHPNGRIVVSQVIGPPRQNLRTGASAELNPNTDYSDVRMDVFEPTLPPPALTFAGNEPFERSGYRDFPDNDSFAYSLQPEWLVFQGTSGSNATRYTPNVAGLTIRGYIYDPGAPAVSRNYRDWDAEALPSAGDFRRGR